MSMPYSSWSRRKVRYSSAPVATPSAVLAITLIAQLLNCRARAVVAQAMVSWRRAGTACGAVDCGQVSLSRSVACTTHQRAGVQDQRHRAIAQDGGARNVGHLAVVRFQVLDHHLVLAQQLVDQQGHAAAVGLDQDRKSVV